MNINRIVKNSIRSETSIRKLEVHDVNHNNERKIIIKAKKW